MQKTFFLIALFLNILKISFAQDGGNDMNFNPSDVGFGYGDAANNTIQTTLIQSDGKIIIGGYFTTYDGTSRNSIARLNSDVTLDAGFVVGTGANNPVFSTALQSDGKIIIGGSFT